MSLIVKQLDVNNYTVLCFKESIIDQIKNRVKIDDNIYNTEIVFDMEKSVAINAKGNFVGKNAVFLS